MHKMIETQNVENKYKRSHTKSYINNVFFNACIIQTYWFGLYDFLSTYDDTFFQNRDSNFFIKLVFAYTIT